MHIRCKREFQAFGRERQAAANGAGGSSAAAPPPRPTPLFGSSQRQGRRQCCRKPPRPIFGSRQGPRQGAANFSEAARVHSGSQRRQLQPCSRSGASRSRNLGAASSALVAPALCSRRPAASGVRSAAAPAPKAASGASRSRNLGAASGASRSRNLGAAIGVGAASGSSAAAAATAAAAAANRSRNLGAASGAQQKLDSRGRVIRRHCQPY